VRRPKITPNSQSKNPIAPSAFLRQLTAFNRSYASRMSRP